MIRQGDVWWLLHPAPDGVGAERRPAIVVQSDDLNVTNLPTVLVVPCTGNLEWTDRPGCAVISSVLSGLPRDAVAQAFAATAIPRAAFAERTGRLSPAAFESVLNAIDDALGR